MLDHDSQGRFITGYAGIDGTPLDIMSSDVNNWLQEQDFWGHPNLAVGEVYRWDTPDKYTYTPWRAAGCRLRIVGGEVASLIRVISVTDALDAQAPGTLDGAIQRGPSFDVPAGAIIYQRFAVPPASQFGLLLEAGALASFELHWLRGF